MLPACRLGSYIKRTLQLCVIHTLILRQTHLHTHRNTLARLNKKEGNAGCRMYFVFLVWPLHSSCFFLRFILAAASASVCPGPLNKHKNISLYLYLYIAFVCPSVPPPDCPPRARDIKTGSVWSWHLPTLGAYRVSGLALFGLLGMPSFGVLS